MIRTARALAVLIAALAAGPMARSQVPPDIAAQLRAIGRVVEVERTGALYAPQQPKPPYEGAVFERDIKYGPDPKQDLDVAKPAGAGTGRPVILFVHGGAFVGGDKSRNGKGEPSPFYDNIMLWAAGQGMVGVNMNYRLAPGAPYPAAQEDIAKVIVWVQHNITRYGGDPQRIYLWGHSAGASHVATYVAHPQFYPAGGIGIRAAIMGSGVYELEAGPDAKPSPYYGDPSTFAQRSPKPGLLESKIPLFFSAAELNPPFMNAQQQMIRGALCARGRCPGWILLKDESHLSEVYSVGTADRSLTDPLLAFIKAH